MGFTVGKRIQITHIVSDEMSWGLRTNDLVHWEFIKWGCENGYSEFDFGSVRYDGQRRYKKKWGTKTENGGYYFLSTMPAKIRTFGSSSKTMRTFSKIWSLCVPRFVTPILGPVIRKQLIR
jgi:hypothetical protein